MAQAYGSCGCWCNLPHLLLVDAGHRELRGALDCEGDALRRGRNNRVAVADGELEVFALSDDAVADTDDLELLLIPVGNPCDHVGHQCAGQSV